jgi:hypothetical protein
MNFFVGEIPVDINRLSPQLRYFNVGGNNFTGDIPATIAMFPELTTLYLFQNQFNGSFPEEIGTLSNLEVLGLSFNEFTPATIPASFGNLRKLKFLWMTESRLVGEIPASLGNLTALEFIDLSVNDLSGSIPLGFFLLENLTEIYLYHNNLNGSIPQRVQALNLKKIDLSENNLTGEIPEDFGKLTKLTNLTLLRNQLSGEVPVGIGRLPELRNIRLFENNLTGRLPPDFGRFSGLVNFEVDRNQFFGGLPENLCARGVLVGLVAYRNNLSGEIPRSLGNCSTLLSFQMYDNSFSGQIPNGLWTSPALYQLMINNNMFSGELPEEVSPQLSLLEISNNNFSGDIPTRISTWRNVRVLRASNNFLSGKIPQEITSLPLLITLLLDGNQLSGQIPASITSWTSLTLLDLSGNQLSGQIPAALGFLPVLTDIDFSRNELSGQIPPAIGNLRLLNLNLSSNRLTGRLPGSLDISVYDSSFLNNPELCASTPSLSLASCRSNSPGPQKISTGFIILITSLALLISMVVVLFALYVVRIIRVRKSSLDSTWKLTSFQRLSFTESTILTSLSENNVIGSGGSGKVYRIPVNHTEYVAVKRIWTDKKIIEDNLEKQFDSEVEILSTIRHANIVKLLCCISSNKSKLLVYPYLENRSLDQWLHGKKTSSLRSASVRNVNLDWPKRLHIAVGAARGLCYMHHDCAPPIIHRDVKSSNILLDSEFNAKIADFGLSRILIKHEEHNTMSAVAGTFGYIAPEFAHTTRVNAKIDVYSFGVVLLELVTGREANRGDEYTSLAEWAWQHVQQGYPMAEALDQEIIEPFYKEEMIAVFKLGIICTGTLPSTRPTMKEVLQILVRCCPTEASKVKNVVSEVDSLPLLKNSKREIAIDDDLVSIV